MDLTDAQIEALIYAAKTSCQCPHCEDRRSAVDSLRAELARRQGTG